MKDTGCGEAASEGVVTILPRAHDATGLTLANAVTTWHIQPILRKLTKDLDDVLLAVLDDVLYLGLDDGGLRVRSIMIPVLAILSKMVRLLVVCGHIVPVNLNLVLNTSELTGDI